MSNEQKPSADALKFADWALAYFVCVDQDTRYTFVSKIDELLARVRREARAEAFEEAASAADDEFFDSPDDDYQAGKSALSVELAHQFRALAAKERAS